MKKPAPSVDNSPELLVEERRVRVATDADIVAARQHARDLALRLRFSGGEATIVATAISELARNIVDYAPPGELTLRPIENGNRRGLLLIAEDKGPGIRDLTLAMRDGYSTAGRLGLGLPGVKRLMDEFEIASEVGKGTRVTVKKWASLTQP
jgi:serine/threonine-protein kinase RsbT